MSRPDLAAKVARLNPRTRLRLRMRAIQLRMEQQDTSEAERQRLYGQLTVLAEQLANDQRNTH